MIRLSILGSGSKGNAVWVQVDSYGMLFDAGISHKAIKDRLLDIDKIISKDVQEVFISHEHGDHNKAVKLIKKNYPVIPVFHQQGGGHKNVKAVPLQHDDDLACVGFTVRDNSGNKLAYIPDTKDLDEDALGMLFDCSIIIFEFNYDLKMLIEDCPYPDDLKERIAAAHMENSNAASIISCLTEGGKEKGLQYLIPFHLSRTNNRPENVMLLVRRVVPDGCRVVLAEQDGWGHVLTVL